MKTNQKGFSVVEILIVIVVVGLLGAVGWLVYDRQKSSNKEQASSTTQTEQIKKEPEAPKSSVYKNDELGLSLSYPTEWGTASLADGPLSKYQSGKYKQLSFSKVTNVSVNFVTGPYSSPLDACGYDDPVQNAQHAQNANQASLIGWEANNIKRYMTGQGFNGPTVYKQSKTAGDAGPGYTEISTSNKVLIYKDIDKYPVKASSGDGCSPITQAQADEANAFVNFFHYAVNYSNSKVFGVNGQFDARKGDSTTVRGQLTDTLNTIK
jgi:prepilin-type N-terminal cleavage/methylation domain-containing protein